MRVWQVVSKIEMKMVHSNFRQNRILKWRNEWTNNAKWKRVGHSQLRVSDATWPISQGQDVAGAIWHPLRHY